MEHSDQQLDEWARSLEEAIFIEDLRDLRDLRDKGYGLLHPVEFDYGILVRLPNAEG